ncbi:hypothetical protein DR79_79 [Francisella tularensis]|uniref:Uncharacterized protein n=2 Tax=Francisella tularensis TaxID=263 RepID=A0AAW3D7M9_FRATU|nr:hypothetical protein NE061598_02810 [Francisella tularensis subsp. tularensis NE061598]AJI68502.1 hypothetical protein BZ14_339 [Francisella tularensis subsp. tularensis SCHU S4]AJI72016.1 hypothetical protein CH69_305 [Francisella tularensis subsp. tularensis]AKE19916.1 hypothetical protein RO31_0569 [Francisella tularensis subsp. tularensis str. SCHU S4 substr. NR-28534]EOA42354.1 hypothetical protein H645_02766 [Francisella tularensis subsp. tularensis 80700075]EZK37867.1 hypothetical pr
MINQLNMRKPNQQTTIITGANRGVEISYLKNISLSYT